MTDPLATALSCLATVLDSLGIRYVVIGSLASSARGLHRATMDGDLLAYILPQQARQLTEGLGKDWYAEPDAIENAIRNRRSFNVIHIPTATKVDIFPASTDFHVSEMERASPATVFPTDRELRLPVTSPEDVILSKLRWYADGGEVSEKQWMDIMGVIDMRHPLDLAYMTTWAARLGVSRLLARALEEGKQDT